MSSEFSLPQDLSEKCRQMRRQILEMSTAAGSGHPTSSLSGVEIMAVLHFCGFFQAPDYTKKNYPTQKTDENEENCDRLIFSKGHASPLFYALYQQLGVLSEEELLQFRRFDSVLEGHPTPRFAYTEATTGSLGQGLSVAAGLAWALEKNRKNSERAPKVWVLLGDSELAEGSVWEGLNFAFYNNLGNLRAVVDLNRLGQTGQTQLGHDAATLAKRIESFGWQVQIVEDGHNLQELFEVYQKQETENSDKPQLIIAKTYKGKGVSFLENQDGWHGKSLSKEELKEALQELNFA